LRGALAVSLPLLPVKSMSFSKGLLFDGIFMVHSNTIYLFDIF